MSRRSFPDDALEHLPADKVIILKNKCCSFCSEELTESNRSEEHIVGRRFVPKGKLNGSWNLKLNACRSCNGLKADLEDDISAITLYPQLGGSQHHEIDVAADALRKARGSFSRRTGKPVCQSRPTIKLKSEFGPMTMEASLVASPQIDLERVHRLAYYQVAGFFYFLTYREELATGYKWPGDFMPVQFAPRSDWGNRQIIDFAKVVRNWLARIEAVAAEEYYKVSLRKHPLEELWSWALEWNKAYRVIGFLGDSLAAKEVMKSVSELRPDSVWQDGDATWTRRREIPLREGDIDELFIVY